MMKKCLLLLLFLISLPFLFADENSDKTVLKNPSFEVSDAQGGPQSWGGSRKYFQITTGEARTGNACLKWEGNDQVYSLSSQKTKLKGGDCVEFSVWVKTENIKNGRAAICLEWSKKEGGWYGGSYASGIGGTQKKWTRIFARAVVPEDAASPSITCYVTKGGTGKAWFDDVEINAYIPPLFSAMTTDQYRQQSIGGPVQVCAGFNRISKTTDYKTLKPKLELIDSQGKTTAQFKPNTVENDYLHFSFDSTKLPLGKYKLICSMINPNSQKIETVSCSFTRIDKFPDRVSYIDKHLRLIHNGKPFFPLGLYMGGAPAKDVELIGKSAFNCIMPYAPISRNALDNLDAHGLKVIYSVKDNFPGLQSNTMKEGNERTEKTVRNMKDHPAILAWYINDELPLTMIDDLTARRDQMEELDPGRPTWVVLYQINEIRSYLPTFDVIGTDPYPIPAKPASTAADWARKTHQAAFGYRAVWEVPQIFDWGSYRHTESEKKNSRPPTFEEMRGMSWMCIANGANGLIFYSFYDLYKMDKTIANGGKALVRQPFEVRWNEVKTVAQEIADQFPILLADKDPLKINAAKNNDPETIFRLYGSEQGTWILSVNTAPNPKTAVFDLPDDVKLTETKLGPKAVQNGSQISVSLKPFEPCLILVAPIQK